MKIARNLTAMAAVAAALALAAQARADTISFFLTTPETGSPPTQPVEVTVSTWTTSSDTVLATGPSTFATVVFSNPDTSVNMAPVEININGAFLASTPEGLAGGHSPCGGNGGPTPTCVIGGDGAGTFGQMSIETGSSNNSTITITLTAEGTNTWANAAAVLTPNSKGFEALVNDASNGTQDAGFATPLPAALPLFATGLGALGLLGWRRKRAARSVAG